MQAVSRDVKINRGVGYKINKPLSDLLVLRLIMSLAERLSSKLHIFSRSFASRPNILIFGQCIGREHFQPIYKPPVGVYLLVNVKRSRTSEPSEKSSNDYSYIQIGCQRICSLFQTFKPRGYHIRGLSFSIRLK